MAASEEFRKKLKEGELVDALTLALSEAIELKITTWVSTPNSMSHNPLSSANEALPGHRMHTRINIVDGDIDNEVGSEFMSSGPYAELQEFHLQQVQQGRNIIQQNLESLQRMFLVLTHVKSEMSRENPRLTSQEVSVLPPSSENLSS